MKTNLEKNMESILNLPENITPISEVIDDSRIEPSKPALSNDDVMDDYRYARDNLRQIIDSAQTSIEDLASIAATSESPRAYEVLSTLMKTIVDANHGLLDLQKKVKQIQKEESGPSKPSNVTNALFVGSTAELHKLIKNSD